MAGKAGRSRLPFWVCFVLCEIASGDLTYYMEDYCNSTGATTVFVPVLGESSSVTIQAFRNSSGRAQNCKAELVLETEAGARLGLRFAQLDTFTDPTENFCIDYLDMHPTESFLTRFCGSVEDLEGGWQESEDNNLSVTWNRYTEGKDSEAVTKGFKLVITAFVDAHDGTCPQGTFYCATGQCIDQRRKCDQKYNCEDFSDEMECPNSNASGPEISLAGIAVVLATAGNSWKLT